MDVTKRSHFSHLSGSQAASSLVGALVEENGTARTVAKLNSLVFATGSLGTTRSLSSPRVDSGDMPGLRDRSASNPQAQGGLGKANGTPRTTDTRTSPVQQAVVLLPRLLKAAAPPLPPLAPRPPGFYPTAESRATPPSVTKPRASKERAALSVQVRVPAPPPPPVTMSSEELARKLQRRLRLEALAETNQGAPQPAPCAASAGDREPEPPARAPTVSADSELSAKLSRRLDIHQGAARSRRSKVFNPYTEFPEFSRRLLKNLESMFKM